MEEFHISNPFYMKQINQASELNKGGNVQGAASIIYNLINRNDKSKEDELKYSQFLANIQSLGSNLYAEL